MSYVLVNHPFLDANIRFAMLNLSPRSLNLFPFSLTLISELSRPADNYI